jgi:hypothetical protein
VKLSGVFLCLLLTMTAGCSATPEKAAAQPAVSASPTPSVQVTAENALPGSKDWKIKKRGAENEIRASPTG